jgi:hypothetical protein
MPLLTWQLWLAKALVTEICWQAAKISALVDAGKGCTINASTFNQDWDSGCCSFGGEETRMDGKRENLAPEDAAILWSKRVKVGSKNPQNS